MVFLHVDPSGTSCSTQTVGSHPSLPGKKGPDGIGCLGLSFEVLASCGGAPSVEELTEVCCLPDLLRRT